MDAANVVLSALKDRGIPIRRDDINQAFNDEAIFGDNAKWVVEHLGHDTLLSQEELSLYLKLENSGALQTPPHNSDFDATRPFLDEDLREAIESLNASTAAIQKQMEVLNSQCANLDKQLRLKNERESRQNRNAQRLRQKHELGRQNVTAASSDLTHEIDINLKSESEKATTDGKRILSSLTSRLKENDRILADLEKLASGLKSTGDDASVVRRTSELGSMLAQYTAEEIQLRLDRSYLESIWDAQATANHSIEVEEDAFMALDGELESLYPEIDILAEMSTKQQFGDPILRELHNHHGKLRVSSHKKHDHILETITEMKSSTDIFTKHLQDRESFCGTLEAFIAAYRFEVGDQFMSQPTSRRDTMKRRSIQTKSIPTPSEIHVGTVPESQTLAGLLRRVGLPSELVLQSEEEDGGLNVLYDKRQHMIECLRSYGVAADAPLMAEIVPTDRATRLLLLSLNANAHFEPSLSHVGQESRLSELESELGHIQKGIEKLSLDVLHRRDKDQEKFMERWA